MFRVVWFPVWRKRAGRGAFTLLKRQRACSGVWLARDERGLIIVQSHHPRASFDADSVTFKVKNYRLNGPKRHTTMTKKLQHKFCGALACLDKLSLTSVDS